MNQSIRNPAHSQPLPTLERSCKKIRLLVCVLSLLTLAVMVYGSTVNANSDDHSDTNSEASSDTPLPVSALPDAGSAISDSPSLELPSTHNRVDGGREPLQAELITRLGAVYSTRIVMHGKESTARLAGQISTLFSALGANQVEQRIVDVIPDNNQVRYFHSADQEAGQVVGDVMRLVFDDIAIKYFENYQPSPSEGLIEIWLR